MQTQTKTRLNGRSPHTLVLLSTSRFSPSSFRLLTTFSFPFSSLLLLLGVPFTSFLRFSCCNTTRFYSSRTLRDSGGLFASRGGTARGRSESFLGISKQGSLLFESTGGLGSFYVILRQCMDGKPRSCSTT